MSSMQEIEKAPVTDLVLNKVLTPAVVFAPGGVEIKGALIGIGLTETAAVNVTSAIARSEIPHTKITY